jgi:tetratricopeptide (TPR) repeat protein
VRRLIVRPTSSILHYGDSQVDAFVAGEELNVKFLLEGYVQRAGDRIRVSVQLLNREARTTLWAEAFNENFTDVFSIQDAISTKVAEAIVPRLSDFERGQLAKRGTNNAQAFEAYLRGRHHFHSLTEEGFAKSLQDYYHAIAHDPGYALAYAGIADYYIFLGIYGILPFAESSAAAKEAAQRAVSLDENLSEGYAALAFAMVCHDFDWEAAEQYHLRAIELNPNSATAHNWYAFMLLQEARYDESLLEINRTMRLDPVSPLVAMSLAWCYYHWRRIDEALAVYRRVMTSEPRFAYGRIMYSWALRVAGHHEEAIVQALKSVEFAGEGQLYLTGLAAAYASAGQREEARRLLERLERMRLTRYVSPYCLATVYCELGDAERAMKLIEEALEIKDAWATWLLVDPQMDSLRSDPRYTDYIRRTNNPGVSRPFSTTPSVG